MIKAILFSAGAGPAEGQQGGSIPELSGPFAKASPHIGRDPGIKGSRVHPTTETRAQRDKRGSLGVVAHLETGPTTRCSGWSQDH